MRRILFRWMQMGTNLYGDGYGLGRICVPLRPSSTLSLCVCCWVLYWRHFSECLLITRKGAWMTFFTVYIYTEMAGFFWLFMVINQCVLHNFWQAAVLLMQMWWMSRRMHIRVLWTLPKIKCSQHILFVLVSLSTSLYSSTKYRMPRTRHANWLNRSVVTFHCNKCT